MSDCFHYRPGDAHTRETEKSTWSALVMDDWFMFSLMANKLYTILDLMCEFQTLIHIHWLSWGKNKGWASCSPLDGDATPVDLS